MALKISNNLTSEERHYLQNLITSGAGEVRTPFKTISPKATHELIVEKGFVVGAKKILKKAANK